MKNKIRVLLLAALSAFISAQAKTTQELEQLTFAADSLYSLGQIDAALAISEKIIRLAEQTGDEAAITSSYTSQGVYLRSSGRIEEAVKAYDTALKHARLLPQDSQENLESLTTLYNNLATLHLDMKNAERAGRYAEEAVKLAEKCEDKDFRSQIFAVCSSIFIKQEKFSLAKTYLTKAAAIAHDSGQTDAELSSRSYYLLALFRSGASSDEINTYMDETQKLTQKVQSTMTLVVFYQIQFIIRQAQKDYAGAIETAGNILHLPNIGDYPFLLYDIYNNLHLTYKESGNYKMAYGTLLKAKELSDSLFVDEKSRQLEELSEKYESQKKELELQQLNEKRTQERHIMQGWIIGLAFILTIAVSAGIYLLQRQKLKLERQKRKAKEQEKQFEQLQRSTELQMTHDYLEQLEEERSRLAKELHDGICNDLLALEMKIQSESENTKNEWTENLKHTRENIRKVSHALLPPTFQAATIDQILRSYLNDLSAGRCRINLITLPEDADWSVLPDEMALNIYRIIQEATGNALKHASASAIEVSLKWELPDLVLNVTDNGKGISEGRKATGLRSIKERAKDLKAKLHIQTSEAGSSVEVTIPIFR